MPGEEGYPAYLSSRLAEFYERAGIVKLLGSTDSVGSVTAIGAVSPPGGDLSEPVTQATLRIVKVFWGLSASLAYKRHFPAIDWLTSYSLYTDRLDDWYCQNVDESWKDLRSTALKILQSEAELDEIVRLVGVDALSDGDRLTMETAKTIREDYLHQNAFHEVDTYTGLEKQFKMLSAILKFDTEGRRAINECVDIDDILNMQVKERIGRMKYIPETEIDKIDEIEKSIKEEVDGLIAKGEL